jgi:Ca-activated chloride channel family protein
MPRTRTVAYAASIATPQAAILTTSDGTAVPLTSVNATGRLQGLVFELTVEQRYRNDSARNLEAVFTFPLPLRAVLLGLDLELGARKLSAHAVARAEASEQYERAIDEGNTAVLLEHDGNGLYTVSLGNLMAGETAVIRYRYAELLDAHHGRVRLAVPTVIAPRYGDPRDAGLEGPAVPGVDLLGEYPFDIRLELAGLSDIAAIRSPSHRITTAAGDTGLTVTLARTGFLDRDFVLEIDQAAVPPQALIARDGDGYVCLASPVLATDTAEHRPLALKVLLDCSGSMGGDSIAAAKRALLAMLDRLTPSDRLSLTRFGSSVHQVTEGLEPSDEHTLAPLKSVIGQIAADLGGTEMKGALQSVLEIAAPADMLADVILITDGEVYDVANIVQLAARSKHRLFAIAIGAAPNEALARSLADKTGGGCEFVGPNDDAEAAIIRTFKRLRATPRRLGTVQWPSQPDWTAPEPTAVFPGDTLHLFAGFTTQPAGALTLSVAEHRGATTSIQVPLATQLTDGDLLPRLAAARRLSALDEMKARDLAVKYQLATEHTSFVVVAARADGEKATDLPATVAVPHMLAAGWGGSASLIGAVHSLRAPMDAYVGTATSLQRSRVNLEPRSARRSRPSRAPASLDILPPRAPRPPVTRFDHMDRRALVESLLAAFLRRDPMPRDIHELAHAHPVPAQILVLLTDAAMHCGIDEARVVAAFLAWLESRTDTTDLDPDFCAMLRGQVAGQRGLRALRKFLNERLGK